MEWRWSVLKLPTELTCRSVSSDAASWASHLGAGLFQLPLRVNSTSLGNVRYTSVLGLRAAVKRTMANGREVPILLQKDFAGRSAQY
jgi:hypothetical protein